MDELEINGIVPELDGRTLDKLVVQEFWYEDVCEEEANVIYLCVDKSWYRLYFDCGIVFWRQDVEDFEAKHTAKFDECLYKFRDLGKELGLINTQILSCNIEAIQNGSKVTFSLANHKSILFKCLGDDTSWET